MMTRSTADKHLLDLDASSVSVGSLDEYTGENFSVNDLLLRIVSSSNDGGDIDDQKQKLGDILKLILSESNTRDKIPDIKRCLDLILVKSEDFEKCLARWETELKNLLSKLDDIEYNYVTHPRQKLHPGMIVISMMDDTESKVIGHYGGTHWKRVTNFIRGVENGSTEEGCQIKGRGGADYVSLVADNIPLHYHGYAMGTPAEGGDIEEYHAAASSLNQTSSTGVGDMHSTSVAKANSDTSVMLSRSVKKIRMEVGSLDYNASRSANDSTTTGDIASNKVNRVAYPHLNLPVYTNVYIWECVKE